MQTQQYQDYMRSDEWEDKKQERIAMDGGCVMCGRPISRIRSVQVHHITYARLGNENVLTREEVKDRISAYFQSCLTLSEDEDTQEFNYVWKRNPTKSGLALALGVSPQTVVDYVKGSDRRGNIYKREGENKGRQKIATADFDLIRKAYILIEDFYEQKLGDNRNNAGTIFWLNNKENTRWSNEQEFKFGTVEQPEKRVLSADELPNLFLKDKDNIPSLPELLEQKEREKLPQLDIKSDDGEGENEF